MSGTLRIRRLTAPANQELEALAGILIACARAGASVGFMNPLPRERALAFWRGALDAAAAGERVLLVAENDAGIVGTVQVVLAQPGNQPHRGDVCKLLVDPGARRCGAGTALMREAQECARASGKTLLVLDTASEEAQRLYARLGWQAAGTIPGYALWPDGGLADTVYYYKQL